ncbi:hypothetical protein [Prochlorococcus marinus]|uniref:hypothetical protein n=1 Tax=Prochlorococcus marinus TaxID=1219 RepID=UPI0022B44821|nr:hypothetical protein [Prochlorococcus marinus]
MKSKSFTVPSKMIKYHCPYCSTYLEVKRTIKNKEMLCVICKEPLIQVSIVKPTQLLALILSAAFIAPLIMMTVVFTNGQNKKNNQKISSQVLIYTHFLEYKQLSHR